MKKILSLILAGLMLFSVCLPAGAAGSSDFNKPSSLTVIYESGGAPIEGLEIKTYRVADVTEELKFKLSGAFAKYPVKIYDVKSQAEWRRIESTLAAYVLADGIASTQTKTTDSEGKVCFSGLTPGMYLTLGARHEKDGVITVFKDFLTVVPDPLGNGTYNHDVTAYPKREQHKPTFEEVERKVVKLWKDGEDDVTPLDSVTVDIFKGTELYETVVLSGANNWCHTWKTKDDGAVWTAVERSFSEDFFVTVEEEGNTIIVTNILMIDIDIEDPPLTGDTYSQTFGMLILAIAGTVLIILSVAGKKRKYEKM